MAPNWKCCLRLFPVECIDVGSSGIAEQQRRVIGSERQRGIAKVACVDKVLQVCDLFRLTVAEPNLENGTASLTRQDVEVLRVFREVGPGEAALSQLPPLLGLKIEKELSTRFACRCRFEVGIACGSLTTGRAPIAPVKP
jgi:hypothetical protein